jgi:RHS repeat-associated protein
MGPGRAARAAAPARAALGLYVPATEPERVVAQYVWGARPGHRDELILRDRDSDGDGSLDERLYCLMDYFNPVAVVDIEGEVKERYAWSAFGLRSVMAPGWSPRAESHFAWSFAFHGQFLDNETGYYDYGYRYYSPQLGRWTSSDPIGERGGRNVYALSSDDAVNRHDRFGLQEQSVKRKVLIIGGPTIGVDTEDPAHANFAQIRANEGLGTEGYKFTAIQNHDQILTESGVGTTQIATVLSARKADWESENPGKRCCVDFEGAAIQGSVHNPITPTLIRQILSYDSVKDSKIFLIAHIAGPGQLILGAGTTKHPSANLMVDWAAPFTLEQIFYPLPNPLTVGIYTCACATLPTQVGGSGRSGALITIVPYGSPRGFSHWGAFQDTALMPWVNAVCNANNKPL